MNQIVDLSAQSQEIRGQMMFDHLGLAPALKSKVD